MAKALMFQGTGSDVGKSLLVAGLCRALVHRGLRPAPFKPQNMSNNAAVTLEGGEIGRAQALQARACGLPLSNHMNPVLLKPQSEIGSQVVVQGKIWGSAKGREYQGLKPKLMPYVLESFETLKKQYDLVLIEGAGSAAEVNLRAGDIANMGFACATNTPVVLIGDIDRGGVMAQVVGTYGLLPPEERALLQGYIINKFRGDVSLFDEGLKLMTAKTGLCSFGVATYFRAAHLLPPEDGMALAPLLQGRAATRESNSAKAAGNEPFDKPIKIVVPLLPRISNFDDFDPLRSEPDVDLHMIAAGQVLPGDADLVILPGSKSTISDLRQFYDQGWDIDLKAHVRRGGRVLGICGGYQMLGENLHDPEGIEGPACSLEGLGLLKVETHMSGDKHLEPVTGQDLTSGEQIRGYHMHKGKTKGTDCSRPLFAFEHQGKKVAEGASSADRLVQGAYIHGLFAEDAFRHAFLNRIRERKASDLVYERQIDAVLDGLAQHLEVCLDVDALMAASR